MSTFDVWIIRFESGISSPAARLQAAFGMDATSARALEQSLPKIVKHSVSAKAAGEMRQALEAIGAVVESRPARDVKPVAGAAGTEIAAVFHPPDADLLPAGRISAIDPFAPESKPDLLRISVDNPIQPIPHSRTEPLSEAADSRRITASLLAISRKRQIHKFGAQAVGTMVAGTAILAIGWFTGNSVLRGEADWMGIGFDGLGIYFLGAGIYDLVTTLRS